MCKNTTLFIPHRRQAGAALIVSLVLLVVVTVLAISGMNTATTELAMARNDQSYENAFQAAETGLETAIAQSRFNTLEPVLSIQNLSPTESVTSVVNFENATNVPDRAFSLGAGTGLSAFHFVVTATGGSRPGGGPTDRDATATHSQAFYVVGPASQSF